ncbi:hypothetical protein FRC09_020707 [Ceratobasidium sp. 395]|nr:hypothetical protein FRC09_020707 [Ceratobasidium sp. 395]
MMHTNAPDQTVVDSIPPPISSAMSASEIIAALAKHQCPDITDQLDLDKCGRAPIAAGGFGDVYLGTLNGGVRVAIKCARLHLQHDDTRGHKILKDAARELDTWSRFEHKNIVKLLGLSQFRDRMAMVSPWMENGSLLQYIERNPGVDRYQLCTDISEGVAYLHQNNAIHGDIKSANVLISNKGTAKLADFGCELKTTLCFTTTTGNKNFSVRWSAPEVLSGLKAGPSREADVYALGLTLLETITGTIPFSSMSDSALCYAAALGRLTPERPKEFPSFSLDEADELWKVIVDTCAHNSSDRPCSTTVQTRLHGIKKHTKQFLPGAMVASPISYTTVNELDHASAREPGLPQARSPKGKDAANQDKDDREDRNSEAHEEPLEQIWTTGTFADMKRGVEDPSYSPSESMYATASGGQYTTPSKSLRQESIYFSDSDTNGQAVVIDLPSSRIGHLVCAPYTGTDHNTGDHGKRHENEPIIESRENPRLPGLNQVKKTKLANRSPKTMATTSDHNSETDDEPHDFTLRSLDHDKYDDQQSHVATPKPKASVLARARATRAVSISPGPPTQPSYSQGSGGSDRARSAYFELGARPAGISSARMPMNPCNPLSPPPPA